MGDGVRLERLGGSGEPILDVVFIHGLTGDLFGTWSFDPNSPESARTWPSMLSGAFKGVFVYTLGYPAPTVTDAARPMDNLSETARKAHRTMTDMGVGARPTMIVAHSLGGLLTKQILRNSAALKATKGARLHENLKAVYFLGTPHDGAPMASLARWVVPNQSGFLRVLRKENEKVMDLKQWYIDYAHDHHVETYSLVEARALAVKWGLFKYNVVVVPKVSAMAGHGKIIDIDRDHNAMTRISSADDDLFRFMVERLKGHIEALSLAPSAPPFAPPGPAAFTPPAPHTPRPVFINEPAPPPTLPVELPSAVTPPLPLPPAPPLFSSPAGQEPEGAPGAPSPRPLGTPPLLPGTGPMSPEEALDAKVRSMLKDGDEWGVDDDGR